MSEIASRLRQVLNSISSHASSCGRNPEDIRLLAVSKTFAPEAVDEAAAAGQLLFGENRVQEALQKIPLVQAKSLRWHLIGHLQSNKVRKAVELFDVIQTLDSPKIVEKVGQVAEEFQKDLPVYLEVNLAGESQKSGVVPEKLEELVELADRFPRLQLVGLMAIPPFLEDPEDARPYFRALRTLQEGLNRHRDKPLKEMSMGMSHDHLVAIEEGATLVRLGTAIFGSR